MRQDVRAEERAGKGNGREREGKGREVGGRERNNLTTPSTTPRAADKDPERTYPSAQRNHPSLHSEKKKKKIIFSMPSK